MLRVALIDPVKTVPRDRDQRNFTDPASRIMKNADKAFVQADNAQACVDAETRIIVAADFSNQAADGPLLPGQIEQVEENVHLFSGNGSTGINKSTRCLFCFRYLDSLTGRALAAYSQGAPGVKGPV